MHSDVMGCDLLMFWLLLCTFYVLITNAVSLLMALCIVRRPQNKRMLLRSFISELWKLISIQSDLDLIFSIFTLPYLSHDLKHTIPQYFSIYWTLFLDGEASVSKVQSGWADCGAGVVQIGIATPSHPTIPHNTASSSLSSFLKLAELLA